MSFEKLPGIAVFAAVAAIVALGASLPADSSRAPAGARAEYLPVQSMNHDFGSKAMSGYFVARHGACAVTLVITEKSDSADRSAVSPARVRMMLWPGETAGLESEEGQSLNVTCGEEAATLHVGAGERERLNVQRQQALSKVAAEQR